LLRAEGHKVAYQSIKEKKWKKSLKKPGDIVVVAGGDGTVGKVGRRMIGRPTPIAILPLGTANNVARTLGVAGKPLRDLIRSWKDARCVNCDAGIAKGPWGTQNFIEGFGLGLFAETMVRLETSNVIELIGADDPPTVLRTVLKILRTQLEKHTPAKVKLRLDGKQISGNYLLLEVQNIRYIGPNLEFHREAEINDGFLDVVLVGSKDRNKLKPYFTKSIPKRTSLTVRRARHVEIECESSSVHIDDLPWPEKKKDAKPKAIEIDIKVHPGALVFLAPHENHRRQKRRR
jgi:diacylglycerol kinase family enzyme